MNTVKTARAGLLRSLTIPIAAIPIAAFPVAAIAVSTMTLCAQNEAGATANNLEGYWREPGGSVVQIAPCDARLCLTLVQLPPNPPALVDHHNPDAALRTRPLCGLRIGYDFHPKGPDHADDGRLYDPRAGKTYHGEMTLHGQTLELRGYVGFKALGRSENWTRTSAPPPCKP